MTGCMGCALAASSNRMLLPAPSGVEIVYGGWCVCAHTCEAGPKCSCDRPQWAQVGDRGSLHPLHPHQGLSQCDLYLLGAVLDKQKEGIREQNLQSECAVKHCQSSLWNQGLGQAYFPIPSHNTRKHFDPQKVFPLGQKQQVRQIL